MCVTIAALGLLCHACAAMVHRVISREDCIFAHIKQLTLRKKINSFLPLEAHMMFSGTMGTMKANPQVGGFLLRSSHGPLGPVSKAHGL